jgi:hypothetical protein
MTDISSDIHDSVEILSCTTIEELRAMDAETLDKMQDNMRFFYNTLLTVAAQKRAEKMQQEETNKIIQKMEEEERARGNVNANIEAFNALKDSEKQSFINLGKLYHHARRGNNFTGMEKMKALIMNNLCDINLGNKFVVAHIINLAG